MKTPAKINLFLRITGCRSDGYHELDNLFLPLPLSFFLLPFQLTK